MQTDRGFDRMATVKESAPEPRSYIVESGNGQYRRNRRHLLPVNEPPDILPPETSENIDPTTPETTTPVVQSASTAQTETVPLRRNPPRERRLPQRYQE